MDAERYQELKRLLHGAAELSGAERERWLDAECSEQPELRAKVEELLELQSVATHGALGLPAVPELPRPAQLGPWRLGEELGRGGMGVVHAAVHEADGRRVAIKLLHPHLLSSSSSVRRFLREARVGKRVSHPNVVRTLEAGEAACGSAACRYLVLELVQGSTLRARIDELGCLPEPLVREIGRQIAAGLGAIHEAGLVHRDLKPENVLITDDQRIRIMDLGIAKLLEASQALTRDGQFLGSLAHAAPEQLDGGPVGPAADLYALGLVLFELATGRHPFQHEQAASLIHAQLHEPAPSARDARPELSPFLDELLRRLLAKPPRDRFGSAAEVEALLAGGESSAWWRERERELEGGGARAVPVARDAPLVGRSEDVERLIADWERARGGAGGAVWLEGEPGVGRTRLLDEVLRRCRERGAQPVYGAATPGFGRSLFAEALCWRFGERADEAVRELLGSEAMDAEALVALVSAAPGERGAERAVPALVERGAVRLFERLCERAPTLLVLEDLQLASPSERALAAALARRAAEGLRGLVVLSSRSGEGLLADLSDAPRLERRRVKRLSASATELLVRRLLGGEVEAGLARRIADRTEGVPFFVLEMVRELQRARALRRRSDGRWSLAKGASDVNVPEVVREALASRLQALPRPGRELLDAAAVQGVEFDAGLLAAVLERPLVAVLQELAELERSHRLVRPSGRRFRFEHALTCSAVLDALPAALRLEYHALIAEALLARLPEGAAPEGAEAVAIVRHHLHGSRPRAALPHLAEAVSDLRRRWLSGEVGALLEAVLERAGPFEPRRRAELVLELADVLHELGRFDELEERANEALALSRELGDPGLEARAWLMLSRPLARRVEPEPVRRALETAERLARETGDAVTERRAIMGLGASAAIVGRYDEAAGHLERSRGLAAAAGDDRVELHSLVNLAMVTLARNQVAEAVVLYERAQEKAVALGDLRAEARSTGGLSDSLQQSGRFEESLTQAQAHVELALRLGDLREEALASAHLGLAAHSLGQFDRTVAALRRQREVAELGGDVREALRAALNLGRALGGQALVAEARELLEQVRARSEELDLDRFVGHASLRLAELARLTGEPALGLADARRGVEVLSGLGAPIDRAVALMELGNVEHESGEDEAASQHLAEAERLALEHDVPEVALPCAARLAALGRRPVAVVEQALEQSGARVPVPERLELHLSLWRAGGAELHREEAARLSDRMLAGSAPERRGEMAERLIPHRRLRDARSG